MKVRGESEGEGASEGEGEGEGECEGEIECEMKVGLSAVIMGVSVSGETDHKPIRSRMPVIMCKCAS